MICGAPRLLLLLLLWATPSLAADMPPAGASSCTGCHLPANAKTVTAIPSIEGRDAATLQTMLEGFRSGALPATLMNRIMLGFSMEEISALAQWFAKKS